LAPFVYDYICGVPVNKLDVTHEQIPDPEVRLTARRIASCDKSSLKTLLQEESVSTILLEAGYTSPITSVDDHRKGQILSVLALHHCVVAVKAALDQMISGMRCLGILSAIRKNPQLFKPCFLPGERESLTAG
jgi:hypothetical protein